MMRTLRLLSLLAVCAVLVAAPPLAHADGAETLKETIRDGTSTGSFTNPCTGESATVTIFFDFRTHRTLRPVDTFNFVDHMSGDFVLVPDDPTMPTVAGHFVSILVGAGGSNVVLTLHTIATGVDASGERFLLHFLSHLAEAATGKVVTFDKGCG